MPDRSVSGDAISFGRRLADLAAAEPERVAFELVRTDGSRETLTTRALDEATNRLARLMGDRGLVQGATLVVGFPNTVEHVLTTWAAWKLGAMVLPVSYGSPASERDGLLALAKPTLVAADWADVPGTLDRRAVVAAGYDDGALPNVVAHPGKAIGSGGSTGRPKIIVDPAPWAKDPRAVLGQLGWDVGFQRARTQLVPGPLHHNMPFSWCNFGLFAGQRVLLMERFDARCMLELIERERVEFVTMVPTMMKRCAELFPERVWDLSSLHGALHSAAACPRWVKEAWMRVVAPPVLWEGFGATENVGATLIRGDDWLARPGSVGLGRDCEVRVLDDAGQRVAAGQVGEVFMRPEGASAADRYVYVGADRARSTSDGFVSVGDYGWLDEDGYLFPADRRVDLIITGGVNVYPAEVEEALSSHPDVADCVVIGLPDPEWGKRVHAVVQPRSVPGSLDLGALESHCRGLLASYKVPKTWELIDRLPRDEAGKIRRRALVEERGLVTSPDDGTPEEMARPLGPSTRP